MNIDFPISKNCHVEMCSEKDWCDYPVYNFGSEITISKKYFRLNLGFGLLRIELHINWKGDHDGLFLLILTPRHKLLDLEIYDTRHEEVKYANNVRD